MTEKDPREKYSEYLSKSRLKTWVTCPRKFYFKYVLGIETPTTESMIRGTDIHELFELYYEKAQEYSENNTEPPDSLFNLLNLEEHDNWQDYLDPYLSHFLGFERRRWNNAKNMDDWVPIAVEDEMWKELYSNVPVLMGYADVMLPAASFTTEDVPQDEGCVLVDFKTGTPNKNYMSHENGGVKLDLSYYALLFESKYNIVAVGAYYPKTDTLVTSSLQQERRDFVEKISREISEADEDNIKDYPIEEQPLCAWGEGEDNRCAFYDECESTWAVPIDNKEKTVEYIKRGYSNEEIAMKLNTSKEAVEYWYRKRKWHRYKPSEDESEIDQVINELDNIVDF